MRKWLGRWGTTFIYWSFFITTHTGILLMMHLRAGPTEQLHIWIGFLMVAAFVLHVARNWRAFLGYFKKPPIWGAAVFTLLVSAMLSYPALFGSSAEAGLPTGPRAAFAVTGVLAGASLEEIAPIAGADVSTLQARLGAVGITADHDATFEELARQGDIDATSLLAVALTPQQTEH